MHVIDGNALLQSLIGLPDTFGELALKVFTCLPSASVVHFVTDRYDIKDIERVRKGQDDCNTHTIRGPSTKVSRNWKAFLSNTANKQQSSVFCCLSGKMTNMPLDYRDACFTLATKTHVPY
ncbi:hypothetical protein ElyMa_006065300 [Elysia marginata]|uniref:PIN domain-containing protein n=1 Tax=Elysia marginata TaxID=1093978 RepID=A0AAV4GME6_9GAST|nr:hypothetical protein ElyMa_006065300 [Elysia marginata]